MTDFQAHKCQCCNSTETEISHEESFFEFPILKCKKCQHHFVKYQKNGEDMKQYYKKTYWPTFRNVHNKKLHGKKVDDAYLLKKFPVFFQKIIESTGIRKSLSYSQFRYLEKYLKKGKLLEIGSGEGFILELFEKKGFDVNGVEASEDNLEIIKKKLNSGKCVTGFAEDLPDYKEKFDIIILSHVLEHLVNCKIVISNLRNLLNDNGILFIEVPNCQNEEELTQSIFTQPHLHHFTEESLKELFHSSKLEVIRTDIFRSHVVTISEHFRYMINWILKQDCYRKGSNLDGNVLRLIAKKD